jgi:hypothetical protein
MEAAVATPLHVYLNDHRSGAMMGVALARKLRSRFDGTERGPFFAQLAADVQADVDTLDTIMASLEVSPNVLKHASGWIGEKFSRVKLNPWFNGSPRLTVMLEIEVLSLGVEGKLGLWRSLQAIAPTTPGLKEPLLDRLVARAEEQRDGLERERLIESKAVLPVG